MNESIEVIPAAEVAPEFRNELREWFEREFGRTDRWRASDYYLLLRCDGELAGRLGVGWYIDAGAVIHSSAYAAAAKLINKYPGNTR
jgi:hypothetical protein